MAGHRHKNGLELMERAIALAMRGRGAVEPNPMVGCVIVKGGRVIGGGYHERFGGPHAEAAALAACAAAGESPAGGTAYVNLEPCCHTNKKTPPCAERLTDAKLERVVVGCTDPNPEVSGRGIDQLRRAGITVDVGVLEAESKQLNAAFFAQQANRRPYVTLKWAESADGKVAGPGGQRAQITNARSTEAVHALRGRCDAILVGIGTLLNDDPLLTARGVAEARPLTRIVLDRNLKTPPGSRFAAPRDDRPGDRDEGRIIYSAQESLAAQSDKVRQLAGRGIDVRALPLDAAGRLSLPDLLRDLRVGPGRGGEPVTHLLVEPGPTLAESFLKQGLADRVWTFRSPREIGDASAPAAAAVDWPAVAEANLDGDRLIEYLNPHSAVYFAPAASADFVRTMPAGQ